MKKQLCNTIWIIFISADYYDRTNDSLGRLQQKRQDGTQNHQLFRDSRAQQMSKIERESTISWRRSCKGWSAPKMKTFSNCKRVEEKVEAERATINILLKKMNTMKKRSKERLTKLMKGHKAEYRMEIVGCALVIRARDHLCDQLPTRPSSGQHYDQTNFSLLIFSYNHRYEPNNQFTAFYTTIFCTRPSHKQ